MLNTWVELMPLKMWISSGCHICFLDEGKDKFSQNKCREIWIRLEASGRRWNELLCPWRDTVLIGLLELPCSRVLIPYFSFKMVMMYSKSIFPNMPSIHYNSAKQIITVPCICPLFFTSMFLLILFLLLKYSSPSIKASSLRYYCSNGP